MSSKTMYKLRKAKHKTKRFLAKNHYYIPLVIIILLLLGIVCVCLSPFVYQYITYEGDVDTDKDYTYIYYDIIYDDAIYVHIDGDNSDGDTWETAYTTLNRAVFETSSDLDDKTLIFAGIGLFDVNLAGQLDITKNVHIVGSGRDATIFTNLHDDADYVLNVSRYFKMENCEIWVNATYSGILAYNTSDIRLIHMRFECSVDSTDPPIMLHLHNSSHGEFEDLHFDGNGEGVVGIQLNGSNHNHFNDIELLKFKSGIQFNGITSDENYFVDIRVFWCSRGIFIIEGNRQHFQDIKLEQCAQSVDDEVGDSYWLAIYTDVMLALVRPDDLVGIVVTTGGAGVYGVDVLIYDASAAPVDVPFYIIAVMFEPSSKERYGIRILEGATIYYTTVVEAKAVDEVNRLTIENPIIFNSQDTIYCSVMAETGAQTVDVWIEIIWLF